MKLKIWLSQDYSKSRRKLRGNKMDDEISRCLSCNCMTKDIIPEDKENPVLCGKCGEDKEG